MLIYSDTHQACVLNDIETRNYMYGTYTVSAARFQTEAIGQDLDV